MNVSSEIREIDDSLKVLYVVHRAIERHGYPFVDRLRIVKLLYLLDVYFKEKTGKRFTKYEYEKWYLGPFTWNIINDAEKLEEQGILFHPDNSYYLYDLVRVPAEFEKIRTEVDRYIQEHGLEQQVQELFERAKSKSVILSEVEGREEVRKARFGEKIEI